jgi:hypothetical protein
MFRGCLEDSTGMCDSGNRMVHCEREAVSSDLGKKGKVKYYGQSLWEGYKNSFTSVNFMPSRLVITLQTSIEIV